MGRLSWSAAPAAVAAATVLLLLLLLPPAAVLALQSMSDARPAGRGLDVAGAYIVVLEDAPAATYRGDVSGYEATHVQAASASSDSSGPRKLDVSTAAVVAYAAFLEEQSVSVAAAASVAAEDVLYKYKYLLAGFAARVTSAQQLAALRSDPRVSLVERVRWLHTTTFSTPRFLGLEGNNSSGSGGAWDQLGGPSSAGEDVSICVIDTGIEPEHPSFSDRQNTSSDAGAYAYTVYSNALYSGSCPIGEAFPAGTCNRKLVGCQAFSKGLLASNKSIPAGDFNSCRDGAQHGTHVSATAGGARADISGNGKLVISGMAPKARLAMYKALWGESGTNIDIAAALDKVAADGCDIVNLSLGGPGITLADAMSLTVMNAAAAGVTVVFAAGNSGPNPGTVDNPYPYAIVVAASTHSRKISATVQANGKRYVGTGFYSKAVGPARLLLANAAALPSAASADAQKCFNNTLDPKKVAGTIVVCDRGVSARADKAKEVERAGGIGMLLVNVPDGATDVMTEILSVPHVHLKADSRDALRSYAATASASVKLLPSVTVNNALAPQMASFSSRGPAQAARGSFLTPDITAPGVDVYAPVSKNKTNLNNNFLSGTSMSSPHVAGLAALIRQRYPRWSPMAIKSALMTTAYQETKTGQPGQPFCKPFECGAGHVDPPQMLNPGLIFDSTYEDWAKALCANDIDVQLPAGMKNRYCQSCPILSSGQPDPCDPANLNLPSIALTKLAEGVPKVIFRTVTNVMSTTASFSGIATIDQAAEKLLKVTSISPAAFTLGAGQSQLLRIEVLAQPGAIEAGWMFGSIAWRSNKGTNTRIPLAAKVALLGAPLETSPAITAVKKGLSYGYTIHPGVTGRLRLNHTGLTPADMVYGSISTGYEISVNVTIPENTTYARFAVFQADFRAAGGAPLAFTQDVNIYVALANSTSALAYGEGTAPDEIVSMTAPAPGIYTVYVTGEKVADDVKVFLNIWLLSNTPAPNMQYRRSMAVTAGKKAIVGLQFSKDLNFGSPLGAGGPPTRYLARIEPSYGKIEGDATVVSLVA